MKALDVFIAGENINLCIPTEEFANESQWYSWFNHKLTTRFLEQGMFPNIKKQQVDFYCSNIADRLMLIISDKKNYIGIISLSNINFIKKVASVAIVIDQSKYLKMSPYFSLEAISRITEHAFIEMGMNRIEAGQHVLLANWQQRMELLGYQLEGIHANKFVKGREVANSVTIACNYQNYIKIIEYRNMLWDSLEKMKIRIKKLPKKKYVDILNEFQNKTKIDYYNHIYQL